MKKILYIIAGAALMITSSCAKLDLNPLSEASSENWYENADQIQISLNDMYRKEAFYGIETEYWTDRRTDDWAQRDQVYDLCNGATTAATGTYASFWLNTYKVISRAIRVIEAIEKKHDDDPSLQTLKGEALFFRAYMYDRLTTWWGDAPFYTKSITIEESFQMGRTPKAEILKQVYADYEAASELLPEVNNGSGSDNNTTRVNRYVALSCWARCALYNKDYKKCEELCKEVMDSEKYSLYYSTTDPADSYGEYFRQKKYTPESIFLLAASYSFDETVATTQAIKSWVLRTASGTATAQPSWDLLAAYECTDGKDINNSTLFNPHDPYANRDPRCCMTFAAPGTVVFDVVFNPHPDVKTVMDYSSGKEVKNKDTKTNDNYAAYNGCCIRKGAQPEWRTGQYNENPTIIMRYADVLLMYAEAKVEQNQIDATVLRAINQIRARAYGVTVDKVNEYPSIKTTDQTELRKIIRRERRVELAWEGRRLLDLRRWGLLEKCYSTHYYGFLNATGLKGYADAGNWFWPRTPQLDEDGFADFSPWKEEGLIEQYGFHVYDPKVELFPVPDKEIQINPNMTQNTGY